MPISGLLMINMISVNLEGACGRWCFIVCDTCDILEIHAYESEITFVIVAVLIRSQVT